MKENKSSIFQGVIMTLIAFCVVAVTAIVVYQFITGNKQLTSIEAELYSCKSQLESQEKELKELDACKAQIELQANEITDAREQIAQYEESLSSYKKQIENMYSSKTTPISSTKEYAAWVDAQSATEPYDLYYDLQKAYNQLIELNSDFLIGTQKYKTAVNLLVPKNQQSDLSAYYETLKRYFGTSDISTTRHRFIDDLVSVNLLTDEGNGYYSYSNYTLTTTNIMDKLDLTEDVANALLGLLRVIDWDV